MKKEEKMRKKVVGLVVAGVLVLGLGLISTPAKAALSLGVMGGYYSPSFGQINDQFDEWYNDYYGNTDFGFEAGMTYGLVLGSDLGSHFEIRLEYNSFESATSDTTYDTVVDLFGTLWEHYEDLDFKLTVTPVILSLIYEFSPAYIGAGVGSFSTRIETTRAWEEYWDWVLGDWGSESVSDEDSSIGLVLLGGLSFGGKPIFLNLEARYITGTKIKLEVMSGWDTEVDLSGLQLSLLVGIRV